jgi:hypothetical protein
MVHSKSTKNNIRTLILIARPAAGKSEIIHYLTQIDLEERREKFHVGELKIIDDFPFLWRWFEEDEILEKMGKPRIYTDQEGYFKFEYFWDLLIQMINLEYTKQMREIGIENEYTFLIEFSRGKQHGGYRHALPILSDEILKNAAILYVDVPWEESLRKNRDRFNPEKPDSILEHSLPDEKLKRMYYECDFKELVNNTHGFLDINNIAVPYAIFNNQNDLTTNPGQEFVNELSKCLDRLWELENHSRVDRFPHFNSITALR